MESIIRTLLAVTGLVSVCLLQDVAVAQSASVYRGMFITNPVCDSDDNIQLVVNTCTTNHINIVYLSVFKHLSPDYWKPQEQIGHQKLVHALHSHGIQVHALFGNNDGHDSYGREYQWVMDHVAQTVLSYNIINPNDKFDGILLDAEYWTHKNHRQYDADDVISLANLAKDIKQVVNVSVGFSPAYYLVNNGVNVNNRIGEAFALIDAFDYLVIQDYFNNAQEQIFYGLKWIDVAHQMNSKKPILLASKVMPNTGHDSYNNRSLGDESYMEFQHSTIAGQLPAPYAGQVIFEYQDFLGMK